MTLNSIFQREVNQFPPFHPSYISLCGHLTISIQDSDSNFGNYIIDDFSNVGSAHNLTSSFPHCSDPDSILTDCWRILICNSEWIKPTGLGKHPKDSNLILMTKNNQLLALRRFYISTKLCICINGYHTTGACSCLSWEQPETEHLA